MEIAPSLLAHPSAAATINRTDRDGRTALHYACLRGRWGAVRLLLKHGADPTIAGSDGTTPMAAAKQIEGKFSTALDDQQKCIEALEVRGSLFALVPILPDSLAFVGPFAYRRGGQDAERAYLLWKAWQVADAAASFAAEPVVEARTRGEAKRRRVEAVPEELRGRAAPGGGEGLPGVSVVVAPGRAEKEAKRTRAALLDWAVHSLKPGVFEELMEMMG
jgi:hypothetical protein